MRTWIAVLPLGLVVFTACTSLTPAQSAGLREAQRLADEVTTAYSVDRVPVIPDLNTYPGYAAYSPRNNWITLHPGVLAEEGLPWLMASMLATATLGHQTFNGSGNELPRLRKERFERNRRAVEIMVKFLHMTTREAVERSAARFVEQNKRYGSLLAARRTPTGLMLSGDQRFFGSLPGYLLVPPCDQLHELWSHYAIQDPPPACKTDVGVKVIDGR